MLSIFTPTSAEEACDILREFAQSTVFKLIVIDSIAALSVQQDLGKSASEHSMAVLPRLLSRFLPIVCNESFHSDCTIIAINQVRDNVSPYGAPTITPIKSSCITYRVRV
jgi:recombination protein RecA